MVLDRSKIPVLSEASLLALAEVRMLRRPIIKLRREQEQLLRELKRYRQADKKRQYRCALHLTQWNCRVETLSSMDGTAAVAQTMQLHSLFAQMDARHRAMGDFMVVMGQLEACEAKLQELKAEHWVYARVLAGDLGIAAEYTEQEYVVDVDENNSVNIYFSPYGMKCVQRKSRQGLSRLPLHGHIAIEGEEVTYMRDWDEERGPQNRVRKQHRGGAELRTIEWPKGPRVVKRKSHGRQQVVRC